MKQRKLPVILIILAIMGAITVYILGQEHYFGSIDLEQGDGFSIFSSFSRSVCGESESFISCKAVNASPYATFLKLPQTSWGMFYFLAVAFLAIPLFFFGGRCRRGYSALLFWLQAAGAAYSIFMLLVSLISIRALCPLCLIVYAITWISFAFIVFSVKREGINLLKIRDFYAEINTALAARGKIALVSWTVIALGIAMAAGFFLDVYFNHVKESHLLETRLKTITEQIDKVFRSQPVELHASPVCVIGNVSAPVIIVEFSDFLCPHCKTASEIVKSAAAGFGDKVGIIFMNFPLDKSCNPDLKKTVHEGACTLAKGAICAAWQLRFDEYQETVFNLLPENADPAVMRQIAVLSRLDIPKFELCMDSAQVKAELKKQVNESNRLGIHSTPTLFINGRLITGSRDRDVLTAIIRKELSRLEKK
jgi:protein-disulfide isomerase/uncharacterized membrane protein